MWDQRYDTEEYVYGTEPNTFLAAHCQTIPRGAVLCLAAGEGRNAVHLARQGYEVTAVDRSPVGLRKARRLALEAGVPLETVSADLAEYPFELDSLSGVTSIFCHLPPELRRGVHAQVVEALRPGGVLILEAYTPDQLGRGTGGPPDASLMMCLADLRQELSGLVFEHAEELEREVVEGRFHSGMAAVVQVVARKPDETGKPGKSRKPGKTRRR